MFHYKAYLKVLSILLISVGISSHSQAFDLSSEQIDGEYELLNEERSYSSGSWSKTNMTKKALLQYAKLGNKYILARAHCQKCNPLIMSKMPKLSKTLNRPTFFSQYGIYAVAYDKHNFVLFMPQPFLELGKKTFSGFKYINVYTQKGQKRTLNEQSAKQFVVKLSKQRIK